MTALSPEEIRRALDEGDLPGWRLGDGELVKNYKLGSFREAIAFIDRKGRNLVREVVDRTTWSDAGDDRT